MTPKKAPAKKSVPQQTRSESLIPAGAFHAMGKEQLDTLAENSINLALLEHTAPELYVTLKQMAFAVEVALDKLKESAVERFQEQFGSLHGEVYGHKVEIRGGTDWVYTARIDELKKKHKLEMEAAKAVEQSEGRAKQTLKDCHIMLDQAAALGQKLSLLEVHADVLEACVRAGEGELDNSVIIKEVRRRGGKS